MAELDCGIVFTDHNDFSWTSKKLTVRHEKRLVDALTKVLDSSYTFSDDTILDKLYLHLCEKSKKANFNWNIFLPWLSNVLSEWNKLKKNIKSFALMMAGVVADCPNGLKEMVESGLLEKLCKAASSHDEVEASVTLGLVKMLSSVVKSVDGAKWLLDCGLWELILEIHSSSESIYLSRETNGLIITLVTVLKKVEPELCWRIIDSLLAPLNVTKSADPPLSRRETLVSAQVFVSSSVGGCESYGDLMPKSGDYQSVASESSKDLLKSNKKILPNIQLLCSLIDALLEKNCSAHDVNIIFKNYNLYMWSWEQLSSENYDSELISWLSSLILYLIYSTMPRTEDKKVTEGDVLDTLKSFLFLIQALTSKRKYLAVNNICVLSQKLADKLISTPIYLCKEDGVTYNFRAQILFLHALPIFIFLKLARITHADVADKFADKLFTCTSMSVKRVCYHYRDTIRVCPEYCNTEELLRSSVQTLTGILKYLHKDQVVVVFQSLMHLLREFVPDEYAFLNKVTSLEMFDLVKKYPNLLMDILDGIEITIKNYNITWSESLETSCVLVLLMSLSCISDLTTPLSTKLLQVIHLAISNFLPPNLALLVENFKNSSLELLGPLLLRKLSDVHWEVRDSALEVLQTLSFLSALKFPAFQNLLLELNFPSIIIGMFECDEESYVRSSAIVCLQKMVQVKRLWEEAIADKKLLEKMLECLKKEPEGIVRKEAVNLITAIYLNHEICPYLMEDVYKEVAALSACDLHWEVKVCSLLFWDAVIDQETANQGMIDGVFPAVTFSKSSRKIVALTPVEIKKRLKLVLDNLEKYGCLQALWMTLNDTSDLEVARKSVIIITKLLKLLQQYGVVEETCGRATVLPERTSEIDSSRLLKKFDENKDSHIDEGSVDNVVRRSEVHHHDSNHLTVTSEEVIKSIMDSQDVELLSSVYRMDNKKNNVVEDTKCSSEIMASSNFITVNEFIEKVTSLNLESVIRVRTEWLMASDDLDSLIDDILAVNIRPNINAKDCY